MGTPLPRPSWKGAEGAIGPAGAQGALVGAPEGAPVLTEQDEAGGIAVEVRDGMLALFAAGKYELEGEGAVLRRRAGRDHPGGFPEAGVFERAPQALYEARGRSSLGTLEHAADPAPARFEPNQRSTPRSP